MRRRRLIRRTPGSGARWKSAAPHATTRALERDSKPHASPNWGMSCKAAGPNLVAGQRERSAPDGQASCAPGRDRLDAAAERERGEFAFGVLLQISRGS